MAMPRRLRILTQMELTHLTVERLLEYRKKALCLESSLEASDYRETVVELDPGFIWFKDDPRWAASYASILDELARKQKASHDSER